MVDTIFAVSTAPGKAGIAVIRVSGPRAFDSAAKLCVGGLPPIRHAGLRDVEDPDSGELIDRGIILCFPESQSFTGENIVEYQIHGGFGTQSALCDTLFRQPGHRYAEAGEFARRAMENGRLDLVQLEGLADLIDAETTAQLKLAHEICRGDFSNLAQRMRGNLVHGLALLESTLDFSDESVPEDVTDDVCLRIEHVRGDIREQLRGSVGALRIRTGFQVALVGPPNAGKSTLINAISGREAALTSNIPGTTRDVIEVRYDLDGIPISFLDMAGIRASDDVLEGLGVERAVSRAKAADLRVFLVSGDRIDLPWIDVGSEDLIVEGKADLRDGEGRHELRVSGVTGEGIDILLAEIKSRLDTQVSCASFATRQRHVGELNAADDALRNALATVRSGPGRHDLAAEEIRLGIRHLDRIVGKVGVEDLLDEIFASFCIGK